MAVAEIAAGVWLACAAIAEAPPSRHPADLAATENMTAYRRREFLAGRGLLRAVLARVVPPAAEAEVARLAGGKPYLAGHPATGISVSHDDGMVAVGVATGRQVGVDIQAPDQVTSADLLRRCLGRHADAVTGLSTQDAATELAWVWTVQEACVKVTGAGFAGRPWVVDVPPGRSAGRWRSCRWISLRGRSRIPLSAAFSTQPLERS